MGCEPMKAGYDIDNSRCHSTKIDKQKRQEASQASWRNATEYGSRNDDMYCIGMIVRLLGRTMPTAAPHFFLMHYLSLFV